MTATAATNNTSGRTKKAVVAAALGIALLAGGGGTFAAWNENTTIGTGSVAAGHLNWEQTTPTWTDQNGVTIDPATFKMVPGDVVTYKTRVTTKLVGTNLKANLAADTSALNTTSGLGQYATVSTQLAQGGNALANPYALTPANNGDYDVTVTISLPAATAGSTAEDTTLDLTQLKLAMSQV